jgi:hypothetical protein
MITEKENGTFLRKEQLRHSAYIEADVLLFQHRDTLFLYSKGNSATLEDNNDADTAVIMTDIIQSRKMSLQQQQQFQQPTNSSKYDTDNNFVEQTRRKIRSDASRSAGDFNSVHSALSGIIGISRRRPPEESEEDNKNI